MKLVPVMLTLVPTGPLAGENAAICGTITKEFALVAVPPGVVTVIDPVVAPPGAAV